MVYPFTFIVGTCDKTAINQTLIEDIRTILCITEQTCVYAVNYTCTPDDTDKVF